MLSFCICMHITRGSAVAAKSDRILVCLFWGHATLKIVPKYAHLNLSCSKRGGAKGMSHAQACHVGCV